MRGCRRRLPLVALAGWWLASCAQPDPRTQTMVYVVAEPAVLAESETIRIRIESDADDTEPFEESVEIADASLPLRVAVVPKDNDASRTFVLVAQARSTSRLIATASLRTGFVEGKTLAITLLLSDACRATTCSAGETCEASGRCVDHNRPPETLTPFDEFDAGAPMDAATPVDTGEEDSTIADSSMDTGESALDALPADTGPQDTGADADSRPTDSRPTDTMPTDVGQDTAPSDAGCTSNAECGAVRFGNWGTCDYSGQCDQNARRLRSVTTPTCTAGRCSNVQSDEIQACSRNTENDSCGSTTTSDGTCTRSSQCGTAGTFVRTTTRRLCRSGSCQPVPSTADINCSLAAQADGTACSSGYCCSGSCVARSHNSHCGACNINCAAAGRTCTNAISNNGGRHNLTNAFVCTCLGFAHCTTAGYGADATCFENHCQCQCPAASPTSCGACASGTCFEDTIEPLSDNFCGY